MTRSGLDKASAVISAFRSAHFPAYPMPAIIENPDWTTTRYYATDKNISIPHYTDAWNEGDPNICIHEFGHVVAFNTQGVNEAFVAAMGAPGFTHPLINEVFAEFFARAYVDGYDGHNWPQLVGIALTFDAARMRTFCESLTPAVPAGAVVAPPIFQPPAGPAIPTTMYDSTNPYDIPVDARMVAGYIDGWYRWPDDSWNRFPYAKKIRIAIHPVTDADVLDVEWGAASPADVPGWVARRSAAAADPVVYVNRANWQACKDACDAAGVAYPKWWVAAYGIGATLLDGTVGTQYANEAITGHHYDLSLVAPAWAKEEDMDDQRVRDIVQEEVRTTIDAIKAELAKQAHHKHTTGEPEAA